MPTGLTAGVQDGTVKTLEQFALICWQFGACINMRDDPADKQIPEEFLPAPHYQKWIDEAEDKLERLERVPAADIARAYEDHFIAEQRRHAERTKELNMQRARYESMLDLVRAWVPPTSDHASLKSMMVDQLESSINFDCAHTPAAPKREDAAVWHGHQVSATRSHLERCRTSLQEEVERCRSRTAWVRALCESLKKEAAEGGQG